MISESDLIIWLDELGVDTERLTFYDKGYAFFRACIDKSYDANLIVALIKYMYNNDIYDSRDIDLELIENEEIKDMIEDVGGDVVSIPDLMGFLKSEIRSKPVTIMGGGANECLYEVELALEALDIEYKRDQSFVY
jgi:hypothetical protein